MKRPSLILLVAGSIGAGIASWRFLAERAKFSHRKPTSAEIVSIALVEQPSPVEGAGSNRFALRGKVRVDRKEIAVEPRVWQPYADVAPIRDRLMGKGDHQIALDPDQPENVAFAPDESVRDHAGSIAIGSISLLLLLLVLFLRFPAALPLVAFAAGVALLVATAPALVAVSKRASWPTVKAIVQRADVTCSGPTSCAPREWLSYDIAGRIYDTAIEADGAGDLARAREAAARLSGGVLPVQYDPANPHDLRDADPWARALLPPALGAALVALGVRLRRRNRLT